MKTNTTKQRRAPRVLFPAIGLIAERLKVSRYTLWRALSGGTSKGHDQLRRRYRQVLAELNKPLLSK